MLKELDRADRVKGSYPADLLKPYIKKEIITIISGPKSCNKSILATHLLAGVSRGINGFDGTPLPCGKGGYPVIFYSLEDAVPQVKQRLSGMKARAENVHLADLAHRRTYEALDKVIEEIKSISPALVVIDSLFAFFENIQSGSKIQKGLTALDEVGKALKLAIIFIHHPPKRPRMTDEWCSGTGRIQTYIRNGFYVCRLEGNARIMASAKWQYGIEPPAQEFYINGGENGEPLSVVMGNRLPYTVNDVIGDKLLDDGRARAAEEEQ